MQDRHEYTMDFENDISAVDPMTMLRMHDLMNPDYSKETMADKMEGYIKDAVINLIPPQDYSPQPIRSLHVQHPTEDFQEQMKQVGNLIKFHDNDANTIAAPSELSKRLRSKICTLLNGQICIKVEFICMDTSEIGDVDIDTMNQQLQSKSIPPPYIKLNEPPTTIQTSKLFNLNEKQSQAFNLIANVLESENDYAIKHTTYQRLGNIDQLKLVVLGGPGMNILEQKKTSNFYRCFYVIF